MTKADKMLAELGFLKDISQKYSSVSIKEVFVKKEEDGKSFILIYEGVRKISVFEGWGYTYLLNPQEIEAIYEKVKELGWWK